MKPDRVKAIQGLIKTIKEKLPFDDNEINICTGQCNSCSFKLMEYLETQLIEWEIRLKNGEIPSFGELHQLAKTSQKIYQVLAKNNLVD